MKIHPLVGLSLLLVGTFPAQNAALAQGLTAPRIGGRYPEVELSFRNFGTSEQLSALSSSFGVNVVADATHFAAHPKTLTITEKDAWLNWVLKIANEQKLTWQREGDNTLLFWSEPDVAKLVKALVQDVPTNRFEVVEREAKPFDSEMDRKAELEYLFMEYLAANHGWDRKSVDFKVQLKLSELPPELAEKIRTLALNNSVNSHKSTFRAWFSDEFYRGVRANVRESPGQTPVLFLSHANQKNVLPLGLFLRPIGPRREPLATFRAPSPRPTLVALAQMLPPAPDAAPTALTEAKKDAPVVDLGGEELKAPVSLQTKEESLSVVVAALQEQTKIELSVAEPQLAQKRVTIGAKAMPLGELMSALAKLYSATWSKTAGGYELRNGNLSPALRELSQLGDPEWFRYWQEPLRHKVAPARLTLDEMSNWEDEFADAGQIDALRSPQGAAFSELPPELQLKLQNAAQAEAGWNVVDAHREWTALNGDVTLETAPSIVSIVSIRKTTRGEVRTPIAPILIASVLDDQRKRLFALSLDAAWLLKNQAWRAQVEADKKAEAERNAQER